MLVVKMKRVLKGLANQVSKLKSAHYKHMYTPAYTGVCMYACTHAHRHACAHTHTSKVWKHLNQYVTYVYIVDWLCTYVHTYVLSLLNCGAAFSAGIGCGLAAGLLPVDLSNGLHRVRIPLFEAALSPTYESFCPIPTITPWKRKYVKS